MLILTYGVFDTVAKTLRSTFTSENDDTALRACVASAKDPRADRETLKDCVVKYLYSVDSSNGQIVDVTQRDLVAFASILDEVGEVNINEKSLVEVKEYVDKVRQSYSAVGDQMKTLDKANGAIFERLESLEKKLNAIINGEIKCKKYKKTRN